LRKFALLIYQGTTPLPGSDASLAWFRRFWSAHLDALERHLDPWFKQHQRKDDEKKMTDRDQYAPGPASAAQIQEDGEKWTLIVVRELRHPPEKLWAGAHRPGASARVDAL
jgi:hypothetical protein